MQHAQLAFLVAFGIHLPCGEPNVAPAPRERKITSTGTFYGEVLAVDSRSITIRGKREQNVPEETLVRYFLAGTALLKGEQEPLERSSSDYRLKDVKVGDMVYIAIHVYGEDQFCVSVCIMRRPGGKVPKAPFEDPDVKNPFHEAMNAYQQFEEKGIPLPLKYNLDYLRAVSEAEAREKEVIIARMKREERKRLEGRIAPPPRPIFIELKAPNYAPIQSKSDAS